jgi:integrase
MARDATGGWSTAEPKSARSRRSIPLPGTARAAQDRQKARQNVERLVAGSAWQDRDGLVFTDAVGRPLLPEFASHAFAKSRKRARVPAIRFHDLRHSAASMMLAEAIPPAVISEWLGHAGIHR